MQVLIIRSKWNMGEILPFLAKNDDEKSVKNIFQILHEQYEM